MRKLASVAIVLGLSGVSLAASHIPTLIGGQPAEKGVWPEIVYIRTGNARCSATVVGPRVIMTAGHCADQGGTIGQVDFVIDQVVFQAKCDQAPLYRDPQQEDHDMALCLTDKDIVDIKPASIGVNKAPKVGDLVQLSGYGCIQPGGGGGNDGVLRLGLAQVTKLPSGSYDWFDSIAAPAALCFGDSGGPAFVKMEDPRTQPHYVIGVNSRGDIKSTSMLTALWIDKSVSFFKNFEKEHGVEICGISKVCDGGSDPQPPKKKCQRLKDLAEFYSKKYDQCQAQQRQSTMEFIEGVQE